VVTILVVSGHDDIIASAGSVGVVATVRGLDAVPEPVVVSMVTDCSMMVPMKKASAP